MAMMSAQDRLQADLEAAMAGPGDRLAAADRLCLACVDLLAVDGAAISLMYDGATQGTFGSSGELSRRLDELQFTFGEGPCLDAVAEKRPVLVPDVGSPTERRWPAFSAALLDVGVHAVFALPAEIATTHVGVLDLFRHEPGPLSADGLTGGLLAAKLAALPLMDLMTSEVDWSAADERGDGWSQLASLERVEVYQATGMVMEQLDVGPAEALVRLRAHAFATGQTASEVAWAVVERRLRLDADRSPSGPAGEETAR
jgi:hypothetical protein